MKHTRAARTCPRKTPARVFFPRLALLVLFCSGLTAAAGQTAAAGGHARERGARRLPPRAVRPRPPVALNPVNIPVPEVTLQNQDGKAVRLYPDLMKDKLVVLGFFYTSCPYVCELQGRAFGKLRASLGKRLGKDVFLILATRDPDTDTPRRLKEWGARHGVRTGWTLLTGSARELSKLLKPFTNDPVGAVEAHTSTIFISGGKKGVWYTASGLSPTETLVEMIDSATRAEVSPK